MTERGLTFCRELVPKMLDGSKFVTRRLGGLKEINENPDAVVKVKLINDVWYFYYESGPEFAVKCRQGVVGDRFYMQEAWGLLYPDYKPMNHLADVYGAWRMAVEETAGMEYSVAPLIPVYKVDHVTGNDGPGKVRWRSGRFQPKWACRPQRWELVSIRPERVQAITDEDILAEGFTHRDLFFFAWDVLNGKRGWPAEKNPWVWREEWNPKPVVEDTTER